MHHMLEMHLFGVLNEYIQFMNIWKEFIMMLQVLNKEKFQKIKIMSL